MAVTIERNKSVKGKIFLVIIILVLAALIAVGVICVGDAGGVSPNEDPAYVEITEGSNAADVAELLHENGIIKYPLVFRLEAALGGYDGHFQEGSAYISKGMTYSDILDLLITPARNTQKIVVPVGCDVTELAQILEEAGVATADDFYAALVPSDYAYRFIADIPQRDDVLEGYLYPATYEIPNGMSAHDIVDLMLSTLDAKLADSDYEAAANLGLTMDQVLTIASLVERDTVTGCDLNRVARMYINRARCGMPLESRGTIQFIVGDRKSVLSIADTKLESPYNTFTQAGLPIGPVCNPSADAINAVLSYEGTSDYYYELLSSGEQIFASDYDTFMAAIADKEAAVEVDTDVISNVDDKIGAFGAIAQIPTA